MIPILETLSSLVEAWFDEGYLFFGILACIVGLVYIWYRVVTG